MHVQRHSDVAAALDRRLQGAALGPEHPDYETARAVHNRAQAARPAVIARCRDASDVAVALRFARDEGLEVAVRAGGHSVAGFSAVAGGLVIDLRDLRHVEVDAGRRVARVGGGATAGDLDRATQAVGLATPSATVSSVGVAGFTLGGGLGYLNRAHGLAADNLIGADVVLPDGQHIRAGEEGDTDLLWALRGGGGNFGVVTELRLRLHPVGPVTGGPMLFGLEHAQPILRLLDTWLPEQPEDVYAFFAVLTVPPVEPFPRPLQGRPVCALIWCNTCSPERSQEAFDTFRAQATPLLDGVTEQSYLELQSAFDRVAELGAYGHTAGLLYERAPFEAGKAIARFGGSAPTWMSQSHVYPLDGAAARGGDAAWPWRGARFAQMFAAVAPEPGHDERLRAWAGGFADALRPYAVPGCYANFMMDEGPDGARLCYGDAWERLAALKARYDPANVLRRNQNVEPA